MSIVFEALKKIVLSRITEAGIREVLEKIISHLHDGEQKHASNATEIQQLKDQVAKLTAANGNADVLDAGKPPTAAEAKAAKKAAKEAAKK
jgi:hypothetical protein